MKAAVCREFNKPLVIEDLEIAAPQAGEVKVRLKVCAICHSDIIAMDGGWGHQLPIVYGHEASGVVEQVGAGVPNVVVGDHVVVTLIRSCGTCHYCAQSRQSICEAKFPLDENSPVHTTDGEIIGHGFRTGAFAEYAVVEHSQVAAIPEDVSFECASLISCGVLTGLGAVTNTANVPAGSTVAIIGAGGVGLNSIQGALLCGAETIIAMDISEQKLAFARTFGATHGVNALDSDAVDQVKALTRGRGVDFVFVTVGLKQAVEQSVLLLDKGGASVIVGMTPSDVMTEFASINLADAEQRILGSKMGSSQVARDVPKLISLYQQGRLKLDELISHRFPIEQINEACDEVRRGEVLRNVIVY